MRSLSIRAGRPRSALCAGLLLALVANSSLAWANTHTVKAGESLWSVAKRYRTSVLAIQQATGLRSDQIRPGQQLIIPSSAKPEPAPSEVPASRPTAATKPSPTAPTPAESERNRTQPGAVVAAAAPISASAPPKPELATSTSAPALKPERLTPPSAQTRADAERLYSRSGLPGASSLDEVAPTWVLEKLPASTQFEKSNAARRGVMPCVAPDPGFGAYSKWVQVAPMAHVLAPKVNTLAADGGFDVLMHFHGREPIRKEWVRSMDSAVLVAVDVGIDSGSYAQAFADPRTFRQVLLAVEAEMARRNGVSSAHVRHLGLSAWSAGYGAIEQLLKQPLASGGVDSVILLDGLHVGYDGRSLDAERMSPFVKLAKEATSGERLFFVSHSSISTRGYASSTETARYLIWKAGGRPRAVEPIDSEPMGLERVTYFSSGGFHVRGFRGNGASDHCAQLGLMRDVLRVHLKPHWQQHAPRPLANPDALSPVVPAPQPSTPSAPIGPTESPESPGPVAPRPPAARDADGPRQFARLSASSPNDEVPRR